MMGYFEDIDLSKCIDRNLPPGCIGYKYGLDVYIAYNLETGARYYMGELQSDRERLIDEARD